MRNQLASDLEISALADRQHGVVARRQLALSKATIARRVRAGRLRPLYRGVYAVGHQALRREGRWLAAVLACGEGAVLSHDTAAAAWDLRPSDGVIHVTVRGDAGRARRPGIRVHRCALAPGDITCHRGIPITTPTRTILDLARTLEGRPLEKLVDRAERLIDFAELQSRGRSRSLKAVLAGYTTTVTRSELEDAFLALCADYDLPRPQTNTRIEGIEVDFAWPARRLIVEVDGYAFHRSPTAFASDRERDVILTLAGWRVLRFTYEQVLTRPRWVASVIERLE